tara:strand:- start:312 stop:482 length:171 start_codon:yes stop_codon:yes gene_type:complete
MSKSIKMLVSNFTEYELKRRLVTSRKMLLSNPSWQKVVISMHEEDTLALAIKQGRI